MRTKEFTFKKTKRVKTVTEHRAISIDLTVEEARSLLCWMCFEDATDDEFAKLGPSDQAIGVLVERLLDFTKLQNGEP